MRVFLIFCTLLIFIALEGGCNRSGPTRPANVPSTATAIAIPHGYDWDVCFTDQEASVNKCQIYNGNGVLMYDGVFLRYEGSGVVPQESLKISQNGGEQWIQLENGTILIPKTHFEQIHRLVDWLKGRRPAP
jgi:hypothetical protein